MTAVTWLGHSTVLIEAGGARLLTDPVLRPRVAHLTRRAAAVDAARAWCRWTPCCSRTCTATTWTCRPCARIGPATCRWWRRRARPR